MPNYTNSVWSEATPAPPYPAAGGNVTVDVAIVGGGITGITAALLLQRAGRQCRGGRGTTHRQGGDREKHRPPDRRAGCPATTP